MPKSNRDMRATQRSLYRVRRELVESKHHSASLKKMVFKAKDTFHRKIKCIIHHKIKCITTENNILRQSLRNFNKMCTDQLGCIRRQKIEITLLEKCAKELTTLKDGLQHIRNNKLRNPYLNRKVKI